MRDCAGCGAKVERLGGWVKLIHVPGCVKAWGDREGKQEGRDGSEECMENDYATLKSRGEA